MSARYAIYAAPEPGSALWRFGSRVLGYDVATCEELPGFTAAGYTVSGWKALTKRPRLYGFHGTLKAPFRLNEGAGDPAALQDAFSVFCATRSAFDVGPLRLTSIAQGGYGFAALVPHRTPPALAELEASVVEAFDIFRAPLTPDEIARRDPARLTERQRGNLLRWGYPYAGEDFRFHMTLTGEIHCPHDAADALADLYAQEVGSAHLAMDALVLFAQQAPGEPFRILMRAPLATGSDGRSALEAADHAPLQGVQARSGTIGDAAVGA